MHEVPVEPDLDNNTTIFGSSSFVRKYLTGIFLVICLIVLSVFWGFSYKTGTLIKDQLRRQGHAFFQEIVLTREWAANHGGVFVRQKPGMEVDPYLLKIPGLKVVVTDQDGARYILKNPALLTREISELAAQKGVFKFRITSLNPLNKINEPDQFERTAMTKFEQGAAEYSTYEQQGSETLYRYMAPLITMKPCLDCHAGQGYREGDIRGGISVTITATDMMKQLKENRIFLIISAIGIVSLLFVLIRFISQSFVKDIKKAEMKLVDLANTDFLTGLINRRELFNRLAMEISRARRNKKPLSFIMIDIDHFKKINDIYGHSTGDLVLKELSRKLRETLRSHDIICRYGGEEFLVVAPETSVIEASELAERLRCAAEEITIPADIATTTVNINISLGVSQLMENEDGEKAISRADSAMYRAKNAGRNRVEVA